MTTNSINDQSQAAPDDIEDRVLKVIATTKRLPREAVTLDSSFESLGIDSLDQLNILFDLESEFDIQINDEDAKRVENIRQMIAGVVLLVHAKDGSEAVSTVAAESTGTAPPVEITKSTAGESASPATTKSASSKE